MWANLWLSKANWKSFWIHVGITILWWVVTVLPAVQEYMVSDLNMDSAVAGALIVILGVFIKKFTDKKD